MSRSVVVVLVVDTVNSTTMLTQLGHDRVDGLFARETATLHDAVTAHGGAVFRSLGDGLLATFAAASNALDAAAAMHRNVARLNDGNPFGFDLRVRVTIAASDVVIEHGEMRGLAPVLTARLEQHAGAGETLCTDTVRILAQGWGDHRFERLEPLRLRGLAEPVAVHRVTEPLADVLGMPDSLDATRRFGFVGRAREWKLLESAWDQATSGSGSMVVLAGEPGIGKTRLCREFAQSVRADGAIVLHGSCTELTGWAFEPFVQPLRHCLARLADPTGLLGEQPAELARIVPEIETRMPELERPAAADAETARHRLFEAVTSWLIDLSHHAPLLFVLDDLSWADEASITLLRHLTKRLSDARLLLLASYRPSDATRQARRFLQDERGALRRIDLDGLEEGQGLVFAEEVLGGTLDRTGQDVVTTIARRVGGNPLYLGEVLTHLSETAGLVSTPDGWSAGSGPQVVPPTVSDVIHRRVDRLRAGAQRVLRVASVVGASVGPPLLLELLDSNPAEGLLALEEAAEAGFLRYVPGEDRYEFTHAVFRDVLYNSQSPLRRTTEHLRIAQAIERTQGTDLTPWLDVLAYQFEQCVSIVGPDQAIDYLRRAGRRAEARLGNDHAAGFYRRALRLVEASTPVDRRLQCEVMIELGDAERRSGQQASRRTLLDATRRAIAIGDGPLATQAVLGSGRGIFSKAGSVEPQRVEALREVLALLGPERTGHRARVLAALSAELIFDDDPTAASEASDEALSIARQLGDPVTLVTTLGLRLVALWRADRVQERLQLGAEIDRFREMAGEARSGQFLSAITLYCQTAMEAGEFELADQLLAWIEQTAHELRQPTTVGYAKLRMASRATIAGRLGEAEQLADEAYHLCLDSGQVDAEAFYVGQLFTIRMHQGRMDEVIERVDAVATRYPGIRAMFAAVGACAAEIDDVERCRRVLDELADGLERIRFDLNWLPAMALVAVVVGRLDDAEIAARLRPLLAPYRHQFVDNASTFFGSVEHFYGLCSAVLGDEASTDTSFESALAAHQRLGSSPLLARTQLEYASALARRSPRRDERAVELATAALEEAEQYGYRTIRRRSAELLSRLQTTVG